MTESLQQTSSTQLEGIQKSNRSMLEQGLHMKCLAYLHEVKAKVLTQTIFSISASKKELNYLNNNLSRSTMLMEEHQRVIEKQKNELEKVKVALEETAAKRTKELQGSHNQLLLYRNIFEHASEGMIITDVNAIIVDVNPTFTKITGYSKDEAIGKKASLLNSGCQPPEFYQQMWQDIAKNGVWQGELWNCRKIGQIYPQWLSISSVRNARGDVTNYVGFFADITNKKQAEATLQHLAHYDELTDLPNRKLFQARLEHSVALALREEKKLAVMFLDLDNFKLINDTCGHAIGDEVLIESAQRLRNCLRDEDTVARIGGDEFLILLQNIGDMDSVEKVAKKIQCTFQQPFYIPKQDEDLSISIGISLYPRDGLDFVELVGQADVAMYKAKAAGKNSYQFYGAGE